MICGTDIEHCSTTQTLCVTSLMADDAGGASVDAPPGIGRDIRNGRTATVQTLFDGVSAMGKVLDSLHGLRDTLAKVATKGKTPELSDVVKATSDNNKELASAVGAQMATWQAEKAEYDKARQVAEESATRAVAALSSISAEQAALKKQIENERKTVGATFTAAVNTTLELLTAERGRTQETLRQERENYATNVQDYNNQIQGVRTTLAAKEAELASKTEALRVAEELAKRTAASLVDGSNAISAAESQNRILQTALDEEKLKLAASADSLAAHEAALSTLLEAFDERLRVLREMHVKFEEMARSADAEMGNLTAAKDAERKEAEARVREVMSMIEELQSAKHVVDIEHKEYFNRTSVQNAGFAQEIESLTARLAAANLDLDIARGADAKAAQLKQEMSQLSLAASKVARACQATHDAVAEADKAYMKRAGELVAIAKLFHSSREIVSKDEFSKLSKHDQDENYVLFESLLETERRMYSQGIRELNTAARVFIGRRGKTELDVLKEQKRDNAPTFMLFVVRTGTDATTVWTMKPPRLIHSDPSFEPKTFGQLTLSLYNGNAGMSKLTGRKPDEIGPWKDEIRNRRNLFMRDLTNLQKWYDITYDNVVKTFDNLEDVNVVLAEDFISTDNILTETGKKLVEKLKKKHTGKYWSMQHLQEKFLALKESDDAFTVQGPFQISTFTQHTVLPPTIFLDSVFKYILKPNAAPDADGLFTIAAGASGTGKTTTLIGKINRDSKEIEVEGSILSTVRKLLEFKKEVGGSDPAVYVCFMDVYLQRARVLVNSTEATAGCKWEAIHFTEEPLELPDTGVFKVVSTNSFLELKRTTLDRIRVVRKTSLNADSSRSHLFLSFGYTEEDARHPSSRSTLIFADLAGDENTALSSDPLTMEEQNAGTALADAKIERDAEAESKAEALLLRVANKNRHNTMITAEGAAINADLVTMKHLLSGSTSTAMELKGDVSHEYYVDLPVMPNAEYTEYVPRRDSTNKLPNAEPGDARDSAEKYSIADQLADADYFANNAETADFTSTIGPTTDMFNLLGACRMAKMTVLFGMLKLTGPSAEGAATTLDFLQSASRSKTSSELESLKKALDNFKGEISPCTAEDIGQIRSVNVARTMVKIANSKTEIADKTTIALKTLTQRLRDTMNRYAVSAMPDVSALIAAKEAAAAESKKLLEDAAIADNDELKAQERKEERMLVTEVNPHQAAHSELEHDSTRVEQPLLTASPEVAAVGEVRPDIPLNTPAVESNDHDLFETDTPSTDAKTALVATLSDILRQDKNSPIMKHLIEKQQVVKKNKKVSDTATVASLKEALESAVKSNLLTFKDGIYSVP